MGKLAKRAIRKAALGGSIGPVPKSNKITGEFRNPAERAHGQPWLRPWYMSPRAAEEAAGTRRPDDGDPIIPRVHSIARRADGGSVDELGSDPIELERLRLMNRGTTDPAQMERNAQINRDAVLDNTPVVGNIRSAGRAWDAAGEFTDAMHYGHKAKRRRAALNLALEMAGVASPLPWGRAAGRAAAEGVNTARIFAGPLAKTADHAMLSRAQEMKAAGASRDDIWRETGWAMDEPRGQWYFEIPDNKAYYDADALREYTEVGRDLKSNPITLGEAFGHNELYRAYPDVENLPLRFVPNQEMGGARGAYGRKFDTITMASDNDPEKMLSYGLHEMQHPVQKREAFSQGASARGYMQERGISAEQADKLYRRTAGEVQARNVQARANMTPEDRRMIPPWKTQDVAEEDLYYPRSVYDDQNVLIPALEGPATTKAREMRLAGKPMQDIWKETQRTPAADGSIRREIRDDNMSVRPDLRAGDEMELGDAVRHPALFNSFPQLAERRLRVTNEFDSIGNPVTRTNSIGEFEINPATQDVRAKLAKLLQYEVNKESGDLAQPLRHGKDALERGIDNARFSADKLDPRDRGAIDAYLNDLARVKENYQMRRMQEGYLGHGTNRSNAATKIGALNAGNHEAFIASLRANASPEDLKRWPFARQVPGRTGGRGRVPAFEDTYVLPPGDLQGRDLQDFIERWHALGAGRGKFANGGRASRVGRALRRAASVTVGAVAGATPGRADALKVSVPAGSYVVPADVVAALGEGNSAAGLAKLGKQFPAKRANGGRAVPIQISDGEFVIGPDAIAALGGGDANYGHDILDKFVLQTRREHINHLANLPGPNT